MEISILGHKIPKSTIRCHLLANRRCGIFHLTTKCKHLGFARHYGSLNRTGFYGQMGQKIAFWHQGGFGVKIISVKQKHGWFVKGCGNPVRTHGIMDSMKNQEIFKMKISLPLLEN